MSNLSNNINDDALSLWDIPMDVPSITKPTKPTTTHSNKRQPQPTQPPPPPHNNTPSTASTASPPVHPAPPQPVTHKTPPNHSYPYKPTPPTTITKGGPPNTNSSTLKIPKTTPTQQSNDTNNKPANQRNKINGNDACFEWLTHSDSSHVLSAHHIKSILNNTKLTGYQREIADERIKCMLPYINCEFMKKWAGLTKFDELGRVQSTIKRLEVAKKEIDQDMIKCFRSNKDSKYRQSLIEAIKLSQDLLGEYRVLLKYLRSKQQSVKPRQQPRAMFQTQKGNFWTFGKSKDEWNDELNPEFSTSFRGHMLSTDEFEHYANLRAEQKDESSSEILMNGQNEESLLGASCSLPPGINAIRSYREKANKHKSEFEENLKCLYGDDYKKYASTNGYTAHLLSEYEIIHRVGSGVYGQVFKAKTKNTNKLVAIKTLQLLLDEPRRKEANERQDKLPQNIRNEICPYMLKEGIPLPVIREIMCLKQLNHPNITKLFDIVLNDPAQCDNLAGIR